MKIDLAALQSMKSQRRRFAMLTAYDFPTAAAAQSAGVHSLLIGDSLGTVLLGYSTTRDVPLELMLTLGEAVRRGAPDVYLVGDLPYESLAPGPSASVQASRRFQHECGCDAVKAEIGPDDVKHIEEISRAAVPAIAHLGLRPQQVLTPDGYRAQARDAAGIAALVSLARSAVDAGAVMLLLEAVPNEASQAVMAEVDVPVIGCGAGPACDGHVVVTYDMLGINSIKPPRFVPQIANLGSEMRAAMSTYVERIASGEYPAAEHGYPLLRARAAAES